jgi:transposase InsO family protein
MGQALHGGARTTEAARRAIQLPQGSVAAAARRYGVGPTTAQKWRKRATPADARMGAQGGPPDRAHARGGGHRRRLPAPHAPAARRPPPRSPAHHPAPDALEPASLRCPERHGISRLPAATGDKPRKQRFASYPIGHFPIGPAEVQTGEGKLRLFVAIDRTSKFAFARLVGSAGKMEAARSLRQLVEAVPYRIHTVPTDNGVQFTPRRQDIWDSEHVFDRVCRANGIEHRLARVNPPWTNGQAERMNRTIKASSQRDGAVGRYHDDGHDQLRAHLQLFLDAYNHARRLTTLRGLTPCEFICQPWTKEPERFRLDPSHHIPGPHT